MRCFAESRKQSIEAKCARQHRRSVHTAGLPYLDSELHTEAVLENIKAMVPRGKMRVQECSELLIERTERVPRSEEYERQDLQ
jgi:hypothetical protein